MTDRGELHSEPLKRKVFLKNWNFRPLYFNGQYKGNGVIAKFFFLSVIEHLEEQTRAQSIVRFACPNCAVIRLTCI